MVVRVWFFKPASATWTHARIYRSTTEDGTYSLLASQALTTDDEQYYEDTDGSSSYWYKVSFWDGVNESSLSDGMRGGDEEYYCSISEARSRSGLNSTDVSAAEMADLVVWASELIDEMVIDPRYYWEYFKDQGDNRILNMQLNSNILEFKQVFVDGKELFEFATLELMDNPEFDEGDASTETVEDWTYLTGTSYSTFTWDNDNQFKGNRCVSILKTAEETAYWYTTDDIDVEEPTSNYFPQYKFTCYIKTTSVTAGTGNGAYLQIAWYDSSGTLIKTDTGTAVTGTQDYTQSSLTKPAPWNAAYAVARCVHDGSGGTAYFDVCSFRQVNWAEDIDNDMILLTRTYTKSWIDIKYRAKDVPNIFKNFCMDLSARAALVNVSGGSTSGFDYRLSKLSVKSNTSGRVKLIDSLTNSIKEIIELIKKRGGMRDEYDDDFMLVENI